MQWRTLKVPDFKDDYEGHLKAVRLNSLGSLYWFTKYTLGKNRLTTLHKHLCKSMSNEQLFLVLEVPMSHYKTTCGIGLSVWWALRFSEHDEEDMRKLGYGDAWIRYMKTIHDQNTRTLVTHEIAEQAAAIGKGVDEIYENNDTFRECFRELIPDRNCTWTNHHKFQKRAQGGDPTTGTFEYRGVGQALQGIHVNAIIQDDNFGRAAQYSLLHGDGGVCRDLFEWHKQVGTRFDPVVKTNRRQLVIGNAWGHADLNAWIKKHQPQFKFETHSAEGGCCKLHPAGKAILPEEWTIELLHKEKERLEAGGEGGQKGDYEHFYLNLHTLPWEQIFKSEWLNYFKCKQSRPDLKLDDMRNILLYEHEVGSDGDVIEDFQPGGLTMRMIVDPNHAKKVNRSEHVIWVVGYDSESSRIYLMDLWCGNAGYSEMVDEMYKTANRWQHWRRGRSFIWIGKMASELLYFPMQQRGRLEKNPISFMQFPDDPSQTEQKNRIESLEPIFKSKKVWCQRYQKKFIEQYDSYPAGFLDTLDALGVFPQIIDVTPSRLVEDFMLKQQQNFAARNSGQAGY